nr:unnamed protein product [Digitaria exilis]
MPELPEVEAARRALQAHCVGRRITRCAVADDTKVVVAAAGRAAFERAMVGRTIVAARRKGKNLWLQLDAPPFPSVVNSEEEWPSKYSKFFAELDDGLEFSFTDKRRFARVRLFEDPETVPPISELGPDALFEPMSVDSFLDSLGRKKIGIKALLLDQSFISGIGNWIADEVLYQSRIHPLQIASNLSRENCEALHRSIHEVVKYAVDVDADLEHFPKEWLFHHRWGKKPGTVNAVDLEQLAENGDAKDLEIDREDDDILKPKKRAATSRAARGQQNKDTIGASSRKVRGSDGGTKKPGRDVEDAELKVAVTTGNGEQVPDEPNCKAVSKSDQVTRRSSRKVKPRK